MSGNWIGFPELGVRFEINPVLFSKDTFLGTITVYWYGVITALAFLVIVIGILKDCTKYGIDRDHMIDMMLITTPIGIIGARLFYVIVNWKQYNRNLSEIYKIWHGGLAIYGGIILGIITIYLFCRRKKISTLKILDHIVVYLVLGQVIGRWGNFVNQELFGRNTNLPWGMTGNKIQEAMNNNMPVHPLFLYESLWNLAAFFILLWFRKKKKLDGEVFSLYMILYGGARFLIDRLRLDMKVGDVNINLLLGLIFVVTFTAVFILRRIRLKSSEPEDTGYEPSRYREILDAIGEQGGEEISSDDAENNAKEEDDARSEVEVKSEDLVKGEEEVKSKDDVKSEDGAESGDDEISEEAMKGEEE
ncbi:MAG TPA: prolipoprotein diacylglyceryl transferase [Clostridia bacterium]